MNQDINITNECNMKLMKRYDDNYFDLAIVDPPYGIGFGTFNRTNKDSQGNRHKANKYKNGDWDESIPDDDYFLELQRVSRNQIVWGGNYFPYLWNFGGKGFIFWNKGNPAPNFSDGELAWTSFNKVAKVFDYRYYGNIEGNSGASQKIHSTQKPISLYQWIFNNYAKKGDKILDTHLGSGSIAIALDSVNKIEKMGLTLTACELDAQYYEKAMQRIEQETRWQSLF